MRTYETLRDMLRDLLSKPGECNRQGILREIVRLADDEVVSKWMNLASDVGSEIADVDFGRSLFASVVAGISEGGTKENTVRDLELTLAAMRTLMQDMLDVLHEIPVDGNRWRKGKDNYIIRNVRADAEQVAGLDAASVGEKFVYEEIVERLSRVGGYPSAVRRALRGE